MASAVCFHKPWHEVAGVLWVVISWSYLYAMMPLAGAVGIIVGTSHLYYAALTYINEKNIKQEKQNKNNI